MQTIGYLKIRGEKILVLVRQKRYSRLLYLRKSGSDGTYLEDESAFLESHPKKMWQLRRGQVVEL